SMQVLQTPHSF
nr:immunoglobulin light chain junction region [Macaca mulatta]